MTFLRMAALGIERGKKVAMKIGSGTGERLVARVRRPSEIRSDADIARLLSELRGSEPRPPARLARRILGRVRASILLRQILDFGFAGFVFGFLRGLWPRATSAGSRGAETKDACDDRAASLYE